MPVTLGRNKILHNKFISQKVVLPYNQTAVIISLGLGEDILRISDILPQLNVTESTNSFYFVSVTLGRNKILHNIFISHRVVLPYYQSEGK